MPKKTKRRLKKAKVSNWRSRILPISIFLTFVVVGLIVWRVNSNEKNKEKSLSIPKIQRIDEKNVSFVTSENTDYSFKAQNQVFQAQFGIEERKPTVSFGVKQDKAIAFAYQTQKEESPVIDVTEERLIFQDVEESIDIKYQILPNGIKEEIIIKEARQKEGSNTFVFESNFQGAYAQTKDDSNILSAVFNDEKGNYLFHFEDPFAIDSSGNRTDEVAMKIVKQDEEFNYTISLIVDEKWLNSPDRTYPIIVDPTIIRQLATGGTVTYVDSYTIHTFTSSGSFVANSAINTEVLVVGGGGNGGNGANDCLGGGGGGAGGLIYNSSFSVSAGTFPVTVGGAGANSVFSTLTAIGGGAGAVSGGNGGSGGGSMGSNQAAGTGTSGQGNNGGIGYGTYGLTCTSGGGGGGASAVGGAGTGYAAPGGGGAGTSNNISGSAVTYAVGGGGGGSTGGIAGAVGTVNTGNGGGGGAGGSIGVADPYGYGSGGAGGAGGSGIVIIRYLTAYTDVSPSSSCYIKEGSFDNQLELIWTNNTESVDFYEVQRNVDQTGWSVLETEIASNSTSLIDENVTSNHTYQYRVAPYIISGPEYGVPYYAPWCTTSQLDLGVGNLNMGGLNIDGIDFN